MNFLKAAGKHPPAEDDEPKTPRPPGPIEPEPDTPEPDNEEEDHGLDMGVQVRSDSRPSL
jgi:hypothetical protein